MQRIMHNIIIKIKILTFIKYVLKIKSMHKDKYFRSFKEQFPKIDITNYILKLLNFNHSNIFETLSKIPFEAIKALFSFLDK